MNFLTSIKLSDSNKDFLNKININLIKAGLIKKALPYYKIIDRIEKYNKLYNDSYLKMIYLGDENNG